MSGSKHLEGGAPLAGPRRRHIAVYVVALIALMPLALSLAACGKSKSKTQAAQPSATTRPAAAATAVPTVAPTQAPAAFNQAKLAPALMAMDRVNSLIGANPQLLRDKVTDPQLPFSSVATMGSTLVAQQVSLLYNSFQAAAQPPAGRPFAVQNTVQGYPSVANSTAAFSSLRAAWQGNLFQNVTQQAPLNSPWQESFCQVGNFTTTGGQAQQWFVCMARLGPYIATVSIGGFPGLDVNSVSTVVRAYFEDAAKAVQ